MVVGASLLPEERLARAAEALAAAPELRAGLDGLAAAAADAAGADVAVVRLLDVDTGDLVARAVAPPESALAAALAGSRVDGDEVTDGRVPAVTARAAERARCEAIHVAAAHRADGELGMERDAVAALRAVILARGGRPGDAELDVIAVPHLHVLSHVEHGTPLFPFPRPGYDDVRPDDSP